MKIKVWKLLGLLSVVIFMLSSAGSVHAAAATATITVGNSPVGVAYDSGKGEIFVANNWANTVSVLSDSSGTSSTSSPTASASKNPSVPEFGSTALIMVVATMVVAACAVALTVRIRKQL